MNSTERIKATLQGEAVDRRAFTLVLSLYGARLTNCPLNKYFNDPVAYARGQRAIRETFRPDILFAPVFYASFGAAFGSELHFIENDVPNLKHPVIQSVTEWEKLVWPDPDTDPRLQFFREAVREIVAAHGDEVPVAAILPAPVDLPNIIMGLDGWLQSVLFERAAADNLMERTIPFFVRFANGLLEAGASFLVLSCAFASSAIVTREIAAAFSRPVLLKTLMQINGPVVLYPAAPSVSNMDLLSGLPSVSGFAMIQLDDITAARRAVGPDPVLLYGPDCSSLSRLTTGELEDVCKSVLMNRRLDRRFILCSTGPDVSWNTPPENIHVMRKAVESFGEMAE